MVYNNSQSNHDSQSEQISEEDTQEVLYNMSEEMMSVLVTI